ncbi:MAG: aminotransferase class III-fold pyridoxal phosphate-dependent enzyme [Thermaerobacter sp.]|nr:aminotransferase class III-fold pyridoxal phosphate-dependent enzyme [Thermaerobacter sp.]
MNVRLTQRYETRTPESKRLFDDARRIIPGGVEGSIKHYSPYPLTFDHAKGPIMRDVDGHEYIDYLLSFGALMLGHGHPAVVEATRRVWEEFGTSAFGLSSPLEVRLADVVRSLYPSVEELRFTNSGLEATLLAVRLGLAATGRDVVAKFEGHYHGGHEQVLISVSPNPAQAGPATRPRSVPGSLGLPDHFAEHTIVLPFNDYNACEAILTANAGRVGVVVLEPMEAGFVPADPVFLQSLRDLTTRLGMVLVFDEVKTGFRVRLGGAQEYYGVQADLTALGKILGGGLPIGAVGGRREILELTSPLREGGDAGIVFHSGTFNGNPMSVAAGLATLEILQRPGVFEGILHATERLRRSIEEIGRAEGYDVRTVGVGAVFDLLFTTQDVTDYRSRISADKERRLALDFLLMENGIFSKPLNRFSLSLVHDQETLQRTEEAFARSFRQLRDFV